MTDKNLYLCWFGSEMSESRNKCYQSIINNSGVNVVLINEDNMLLFQKDDHPYHPGLSLISNSGKSDYFRAYMMYHYGGGYTDIKNVNYDWNIYFDMLDNSDMEAIGYREKSPDDINYPEAKLIYDQIIGTGAFIHKKGSFIAKLWIDMQDSLLSSKYDQLVLNPGTYHPRAVFGGTKDGDIEFAGSNYPFTFTELGGDLWHRIQSENLGNWLFDLPYIDINDYR